jgi:hypothetical protein
MTNQTEINLMSDTVEQKSSAWVVREARALRARGYSVVDALALFSASGYRGDFFNTYVRLAYGAKKAVCAPYCDGTYHLNANSGEYARCQANGK